MTGRRFIYQSVLESEERMYIEIKDYLTASDIPEPILRKALLAISEAFTNALIHGNRKDPGKNITIVIAINNNRLTADITDEGKGEESAAFLRQPPGLWQEGGRGIDIMEKLADKATIIKCRETGGLRVSLEFEIERQKSQAKS